MAEMFTHCLPAGAGYVIVAPAKVNLYLELLGKRPDGYHEIATLIATVNLYDTLEIQPARDLTLSCNLPGIPTDSKNLVLKAAEALRASTGTPFGASIRLTKRIPHEAGLGGGSSDAAAALFVLNRLWKLDLSTLELQTVAAAVGSDVPAFLAGPASWCTGRGEIAEPAEIGGPLHLVIVKPAVGLSTAEVYRNVKLETPPPGPLPEAERGSIVFNPLRFGEGGSRSEPGGVFPTLFNRLQAAAFALQPAVKLVYDRLRECDPLGALLSGSGSSVFAVARDAADAKRIAAKYATLGEPTDRVFTVVTCS
jgi:4-diphosphocytidyl-2-C-methyl-D-erythritol kinase